MKIATTSRGILKIPNLAAFFGKDAHIELFNPKREYQLIIGWGNKPSAIKAKQLAEKFNLPFMRLEDGFLRSLAPAKITMMPLAIVCDSIGIYYDAHQPSQLEILIKNNKLNEDEEKRAVRLIEQIKSLQLSKYNHASLDASFKYKDYVLVIDQTYNDLSVAGSLANAETFKKMLRHAIEHNPGQKIIIKVHPEVVAGFKQGYLEELSEQIENCIIYHKLINPWQLLNGATKVYTISSQLGFEALMAGKQVHCFGMPFYAGWGLTHDYQQTDRRGIKKSLSEIFDAVYIKYSHYYDPFTKAKCEIEQVIKILSMWRDINEQNKPLRHAVYFSKWKRKSISSFFNSTDEGGISYYRTFKKAVESAAFEGGDLLAWASKITAADIEYANAKSVKLLRVEDGFLRSVGLGANLIIPQSLVVDDIGIYYDPTTTSSLENLLTSYTFDNELLNRAERLIVLLQTSGITKYNLNTNSNNLSLPNDQKKILVVGQVEDDASIKTGTTEISTNLKLLEQVRLSNPKSYIIYKPHPDVIAGQRKGHISQKLVLKYADLLASEVDINTLLQQIDELHTMTSLSGFEALIRGKQVYCYGMPFYAGWGLTHDLWTSIERRKRKLTLVEVVAATLILYPRYLDSETNLWCMPEVVISNIINHKRRDNNGSFLSKLRKIYGKLRRFINEVTPF